MVYLIFLLVLEIKSSKNIFDREKKLKCGNCKQNVVGRLGGGEKKLDGRETWLDFVQHVCSAVTFENLVEYNSGPGFEISWNQEQLKNL